MICFAPAKELCAALNVILLQYALPIFVDVDLETFQINPRKVAFSTSPADGGRGTWSSRRHNQ